MDANQLFKDAFAAFTGKVGPGAKDVLAKARTHIEKLSENAARIEVKKLAGKISAQDAADMLAINRLALEAVALSATGQIKVKIENGINAALGVIFAAIKTATGLDVSKF